MFADHSSHSAETGHGPGCVVMQHEERERGMVQVLWSPATSWTLARQGLTCCHGMFRMPEVRDLLRDEGGVLAQTS